jgi:hypothetical protein
MTETRTRCMGYSQPAKEEEEERRADEKVGSCK